MTITNNFPSAAMRPCFNGYQLQSKFKILGYLKYYTKTHQSDQLDR